MEKGLEGLAVWQKSIELAKVIHLQVLPRLPEVEKWALSSQLRRSSQSVAANIAEIRKMISGYIAYLKKSKKGANEPGSNIRELSTDYLIIDDEPQPDS